MRRVGALKVASCLTALDGADGLFDGQSNKFLETLAVMAAEADAACRS
jgi:hypothetical protein